MLFSFQSFIYEDTSGLFQSEQLCANKLLSTQQLFSKKKKKKKIHREFSVMLLSKSTTRYLQAVRRGKQFNTA